MNEIIDKSIFQVTANHPPEVVKSFRLVRQKVFDHNHLRLF